MQKLTLDINMKKTMFFSFTFLVYILIFTTKVKCFNIDVDHVVIHKGPQNDTYFGYAVAQTNDSRGSWILVGAPKSNRHDRYVSGDVFRCSTLNSSHCEAIDGFHVPDNPGHLDLVNRSDQWLGATVVTAPDTGHIMTCAPRMWFRNSGDIDDTYYNYGSMVGGCYVLNGQSGQYSKYEPCINQTANGYLRAKERRIMCSAGVDAIFNKNGKRVVLSAPGSFASQGQILSQAVGSDSIHSETRKRGSRGLSNGYMGLSIDTGKFTRNGYNGYLGGAPRVGLSGKVFAYNDKLDFLPDVSFTGDQIGEYFGNSLAVGNYDGNAYNDVAVGAPFYSIYEEHLYDIGRVIVYYQNSNYEISKTQTLLGDKEAGGQFGYSLANGKDLNNDGFEDLIVGAPYVNNGDGAIYIFYGSSEGLRSQYSQVIHARDIQTELTTFGHSITAGLDQDSNGYPDIAVGAFKSDTAVFLSARPVISPSVLVSTSVTQVDLEKKDCTDRSGKSVTCFEVMAYVRYSGFKAPNTASIMFRWEIDTMKEEKHSKRAGFLDMNNEPFSHIQRIEARKDNETTLKHRIVVFEDINDKLTSVVIDVKYSISEATTAQIEPVQDDLVPKKSSVAVPILKYCGTDDICVPDLQILNGVQSSEQVITIGETKNIHFTIAVNNKEEDSYASMVYTTFPPGISYINVRTIKAEEQVTCRALMDVNGSVVICDIGNPLSSGNTVNFTLRVEVKVVDFHSNYLPISVLVNSTNPEANSTIQNNVAELQIALIAETSILLSGTSVPEQLILNSTDTSGVDASIFISDLGPVLTHLYQIDNEGPSNTSAVFVEIKWPAFSENNQHLLYLVESPEVLNGKGVCTSDHVNLEGLKMQKSNNTQNNPTILTNDNARNRRGISPLISPQSDSYKKFTCSHSTECVVIKCNITALQQGESASIKIKSRVVLETIAQLNKAYETVVVTSTAQITSVKHPYSTQKHISEFDDIFQISTVISTKDQVISKKAPIWIIIVSIISGIILLIIIIAVCYHCGFFKRTKKEDLEERKRLTIIEASGNDEIDDNDNNIDHNALETDPMKTAEHSM